MTIITLVVTYFRLSVKLGGGDKLDQNPADGRPCVPSSEVNRQVKCFLSARISINRNFIFCLLSHVRDGYFVSFELRSGCLLSSVWSGSQLHVSESAGNSLQPGSSAITLVFSWFFYVCGCVSLSLSLFYKDNL